MAETNRVVVHLSDGTLLKGTTQDFVANRASFHVLPAGGGAPVDVRCKQMKALFFVRSFEGNAQRRDLRGFLAAPAETAQGKKIAVRFTDGELLCGYTLGYRPEREGFFMVPADAGSNNMRIYVVTENTSDIKSGPAADALAQKALASETS